ncbi:hypothetical protein BHM03_00024534 [Ensete ventricosum]|nr:hypothetical protein BHM03_00024534 [Ensete ventricosum]
MISGTGRHQHAESGWLVVFGAPSGLLKVSDDNMRTGSRSLPVLCSVECQGERERGRRSYGTPSHSSYVPTSVGVIPSDLSSGDLCRRRGRRHDTAHREGLGLFDSLIKVAGERREKGEGGSSTPCERGTSDGPMSPPTALQLHPTELLVFTDADAHHLIG